MSAPNNDRNSTSSSLSGGDGTDHRAQEYEKFLLEHQNQNRLREEFHAKVESESQKSAFKACALVGAAVAGLTFAATKKFQFFNRFMSISAKTAIPVMGAMFAYSYQYEISTVKFLRDPVKYGIIEGELDEETLKELNAPVLPFRHRVFNWMFDHPFKMIAVSFVPLLIGVLNQQMKHKHLKFSQRIMCSRIFAQAGLVGITISFMSFREFMERRGRYEPDTKLEIKETI